MSGKLVLREDKNNVAHLIFNRPDKLNALSVELFEELRAHIQDLQTDESVKVVVIRGAGSCFSAGHDLEAIEEGEVVPSPFWHSETLLMLGRLPQPVIAAVHGHCYTGALEVALAADFIVACENARFGDTHAKWALTPIWGMSQRLVRRVGEATAKRLMFTCEMFKAQEALRIGLTEFVYPEESYEKDLDKLCQSIVANSPFSHAANKRLIERTDGQSIEAGLLIEVMEGEGIGPDMMERIAAFTSK